MSPFRNETQEQMRAALQALQAIHNKYAAKVARQATLLHMTANSCRRCSG